MPYYLVLVVSAISIQCYHMMHLHSGFCYLLPIYHKEFIICRMEVFKIDGRFIHFTECIFIIIVSSFQTLHHQFYRWFVIKQMRPLKREYLLTSYMRSCCENLFAESITDEGNLKHECYFKMQIL